MKRWCIPAMFMFLSAAALCSEPTGQSLPPDRRLEFAFESNDPALAIEAVDAGANVNLVMSSGSTPLYNALYGRILMRDEMRDDEKAALYGDLFRMLFEKGADPATRTRMGNNAVSLAVDVGDAEAWALLRRRHLEEELFSSIGLAFAASETITPVGREFAVPVPEGYVRYDKPGIEKFLKWMDLPEGAFRSTCLLVPEAARDLDPTAQDRIMAVTLFSGWTYPLGAAREKATLFPPGLSGETRTWFVGKAFFTSGSPDDPRPWNPGEEKPGFGEQFLMLGVDRFECGTAFLVAQYDRGSAADLATVKKHRDGARLLAAWRIALVSANAETTP